MAKGGRGVLSISEIDVACGRGSIKIETMTYSTKAIANYFIDLAKKSDDPTRKKLTPMKLQKLVYFAHGWNLGLHHKPLIDEEVQAWRFGPVVNSIYHEFKRFGNDSINGYATDFDVNAPLDDQPAPKISPSDPIVPLLDRIWEVYGKYTGVQLSNATHQPGTPWEKTRTQKGEDKKFVGIPDTTIEHYFSERAAKVIA
jgi:uncharacterized phage-associated protein